MYIKVRALPDSKKESIKKDKEDHFIVAVKEPAEGNRANKRIIELLALELKIPSKSIRMISGHQSPSKIFSINMPNE